eukprot:COSAG03_NODE_102_length_12788_cov_8.752384_1_plen_105_part_10
MWSSMALNPAKWLGIETGHIRVPILLPLPRHGIVFRDKFVHISIRSLRVCRYGECLRSGMRCALPPLFPPPPPPPNFFVPAFVSLAPPFGFGVLGRKCVEEGLFG